MGLLDLLQGFWPTPSSGLGLDPANWNPEFANRLAALAANQGTELGIDGASEDASPPVPERITAADLPLGTPAADSAAPGGVTALPALSPGTTWPTIGPTLHTPSLPSTVLEAPPFMGGFSPPAALDGGAASSPTVGDPGSLTPGGFLSSLASPRYDPRAPLRDAPFRGRSLNPADDHASSEDNDDQATGDGQSPSSLLAHSALTAGSFVPGPLGSLSALGDAFLSLREGDYPGAGLSTVGALGGLGSDAGVLTAGLKSGHAALAFLGATSAGRRYRSSSRALGRALESSGEVRAPGSVAHHLVAENDRRADEARQILVDQGIGISQGVNGMFHPAVAHRPMHTNTYYDAVNDTLRGSTSRAEVEERLKGIKKGIEDDTFP
jgi:hypothetical protein